VLVKKEVYYRDEKNKPAIMKANLSHKSIENGLAIDGQHKDVGI
jgi:hypothetical protein